MSKLKKIIITISSLAVAAILAVGIAFIVTGESSGKAFGERAGVPMAESTASVYSSKYSSLNDAISQNLSTSSGSQTTVVVDDTYYISSRIDIPASNYVTLDLNGHMIDCSGCAQAFYVSGTLTIIDSAATLSYSSASKFASASSTQSASTGNKTEFTAEIGTSSFRRCTYSSGVIANGSDNNVTGIIYVAGGGTLNMYNGAIGKNSTDNGSAVAVCGTSSSKATFNMYGGLIRGGSAYTSGGAVYASYANLNLYAGAMVGNSAKYGSAVWAQDATTVNLGFSSGVSLGTSKFDSLYVSENNSSQYATVLITDTSTLNMYSNAYIFENTASKYGAALYTSSSGAINMYGGYILNNTSSNQGNIYLYASSGVEFNMSGGLIYGCYSGSDTSCGGAIYAGGYSTVTITGGEISNCSAAYGGGIDFNGYNTVTISGATFSNNTGRNFGGSMYISSHCTASIKNTTISGNTSKQGGGLYVNTYTTLTVSNVTIKNNTASNAAGGGIYCDGSELIITNSTITGNTAKTYGAGINLHKSIVEGSVSLSDTEITNNTATTYGGGVYVTAGDLLVSGYVLVSGNTAKSGGNEVYLCKDTYVTLDGSLSSSSSLGITFASDSQTQITTEETTTARYKSSAKYFYVENSDTEHFIGYKYGKYLELLANSEAGAYIPNGSTTTYYGTLGEAIDCAGSGSTVYLQEDCTLDEAATIASGYTISLDLNGCSVSWAGSTKSNFFMVYGTFSLCDGKATGGAVSSSATAGVTKVASGSCTQYKTTYAIVDETTGDYKYYYYQSGAIKDGQATAGVSESGTTARGGAVYVASGATFNMYGGTLYNNTATYGGAVHTYGTFNMYGGAISENYSTNSSTNYNGAAMLIEESASAELYGGVIYGNVASGKGYGVIMNLGTLVLSQSSDSALKDYDMAGLGPVVSANESSLYGGAILNFGTTTMSAGYLSLNESAKEGGAVNTHGSGFTMTGGKITGNISYTSGGGVYAVDDFGMSGGYICYNFATTYGGGLFVNGKSTTKISGTAVISYNTATTYGGGIAADGTLDISAGTVSGNTAGSYGGGVAATGETTISGGTISNNAAATYSGGVYSSGTLTITGGTVSGNTAGSYGGGVVATGKTTISGTSAISDNVAGTYGGGIYTDGNLEISAGTVSGNKANGGNGGGIYANSSASTKISGGEIKNNYASASGGGVWSRGTLEISGGTISGNTADSYAGGVDIYGNTFTMTNGTISNNNAPRAGGVFISQSGTTFTMEGGEISGNESTTGNGGGVYAGNVGTYFTMTGGIIKENKSAGVGGGVFCNDNSTVSLTGGEISGNSAATYGGGVYFVSSASLTIGGDVEIKGNVTGTISESNTDYNNVYLLSGETFTLESGFEGTVYVYAAESPAVKVTSDTISSRDDFKTYVDGKILSDQGFCVGYDGYVYLYENHDYSIIYVYEDEGSKAVAAEYYCSHCFAEDSTGKGESAVIQYTLNDDGTAVAYVEEGGCTCYGLDSDGNISEGGLYLGTGVLVTNSDGTQTTWYEDLSSALSVASSGGTITLLADIDGTVGLSITISTGITLDLNGHTITGNVAVTSSTSATLTVTDSLGGGTVTGDVTSSGDAAVEKQAGTYTGCVFSNGDTIAEGYYALYMSEDASGSVTYTVYSEDEIESLAEAYVEIYDEDGVTVATRLYFSTLEDAIAYAPEGSVITLCSDVDMTGKNIVLESGSITIDLNGFSLNADITISAGSYDNGFTQGATLEVTDTSESKTGTLSGTITVTGSSGDTECNGTNSFSDTLKVVSTAVSADLTVDTSKLESADKTTYTYTFAQTTDSEGNTSYGIVAGHTHDYTVAEAYMDTDGTVKIIIRCTCGGYYCGSESSEPYIFSIPDDTTLVKTENGDGTVTYTYTSSTGGGKITLTDGSGSFEFEKIELTITPVVKIEITAGTGGDAVTTVYYLDGASAGALGNYTSAGSGDKVVVTLWDDLDVENLEITGTDVVIDLDGHTLSGSITLSASEDSPSVSASLEIKDSSAYDEDGDCSGTGEGYVEDLTVTLGESCGLKLSGGTYDDDTVSVTYEDTESEAGDIRDCVNTSDGYCIIDNGNGTFTVVTVDAAKEYAAVKIVTGEGDNEKEVYFGSIEAALEYVSANNLSGAEIVLINDCVCVNELTISGDVTIDLNGNTLTVTEGIEVGNGATLEIKDSSAACGAVSGTGIVYGDMTVTDGGTLKIDSGSFTVDVGAYVVPADDTSETVNVLLATKDKDGNLIYTVTSQSAIDTAISESQIQASITYTVDDGNGGEGQVTVYYESIEDAVSSLKDGDTLTILADVGTEDKPVDITVDGNRNVTVDVNGNTVCADITVEEGSSVIIKDSASEGGETGTDSGLFNGTITGDGNIKIDSGSFTEDVGGYVDGGVLLATSGENELIYTVTTEADAEGSAEASITYTVDDGNGGEGQVTVYYESIEDAIASLKDGDTLTILQDIKTDEPDENYVLSFGYDDEEGNAIDVTLDLNGHELDGGISVGDGVNLTITDSGDESGHVSGEVGCTGSGNLTIEGGIYDDDITGYVPEGSYIYAATTTDNENGYSFAVTDTDPAENEGMSVAATVTFTDENGGSVTVYFEDLQGAVDYASDISSGDGARGDVIVTLTDDFESTNSAQKDSITANDGNFTIDLGDYTLDADVEIKGGASVEITGETGSKVTGDVTVDGAGLEISGDTVYSGDISISETDGGGIEVSGGTFSTDVSAWTSDGTAAFATSDGTYTVIGEDEAKNNAKASVTVNGGDDEVTTYYESLEDALAAVKEAQDAGVTDTDYTVTLWEDVEKSNLTDGELVLDGDFVFDMNGYDVNADVVIAAGSDIEIDLDGGTINGNITVGGDATGAKDDGAASLEITDSSADGDSGTGEVNGEISKGSGSSDITISGGSFTGDVSGYVEGSDYATVVGEGGNSSMVVSADSAEEYAAAYVTDENGKTTYYESVEDALAAVLENGGTLTLTKDASACGVIEIYTDVTIDLNGFALDAEIIIYADEGGSLKLTDGSVKTDDDGNTSEAGHVTGTITVTGAGHYNSEEMEPEVSSPYEGTLVMESGVTPGGDLEINLDELGDKGEFTYGAVTEDSGATTYGIVPTAAHEDVFDIPVWTLNDDGTVTLSFMCACGEYLTDADGVKVIYTATVTVTENGDGTYKFEAVVDIAEENEYGIEAGRYTQSWTKSVAATVEADGKTYYIEDFEDAVELAEKLGGATVKLHQDHDGNIEITGDVVIDLDGFDINGVITVDTGAYLIISGDGNVGGLDIKTSANVKLRGGTYEASLDELDDYIDYYDGYVPLIREDGTISVMQEGSAATEARAAVTDTDGDTVYYEDLQSAVEALEDGGTLILWDELREGETIKIDGLDDVTVNANGYDVAGTIEFTDSDGAAVEMGGGDVAETGRVTFDGCDGASFSAESGDINGSVTFDGCEGASVDMAGGDVTETGSVTFDGCDGASFSAEGGDIDGDVNFKESENATLTMGDTETEGGDINGSVTFDGCGGASVDMDGGNVAESGTVSFDGSDNASFDLDGGGMDGEVSFTDCDDTVFDLGGGTVGTDGEVNFNQCEDATVDLDGGSFEGSLNAEGGSDVTITGNGSVNSDSDSLTADVGSSFDIQGGTYGDEDFVKDNLSGTEGTDYEIVDNGDGTYTVMTEEEFIENAAASVTYTDENGVAHEDYFATVEDALDFVSELDDGVSDIVVKLEDDYDGSIEIDVGGNVTLDLAGHDVGGDIVAKEGATITITDTVGGGSVSGSVGGEENPSGEIIVEGGSYSEDVSDLVKKDDEEKTYVTVVGSDGDGSPVYSVMTEDEAKDNSYVYIETYDEEGISQKTYYETLEDAIAAASDGDTIVLTGDLDVSDREIEITSETEIDLSGHELTADFVIVAADDDGASGSLTISDSSDEGTGSVSGTIAVVDESVSPSAGADYSGALVFEDGVTPGSGLTVDLSDLAGEGTGYHFGEMTDDTGDTSYGIVETEEGDAHEYVVPVWTVSGDGSITLELMCACGEYLADENGDKVVFVLTDATVKETEDGRLHVTGTVEASYTYVNGSGSLVEVTGYYDCDIYFDDIAATLVTDDGTIYVFDDVQSAVDFAGTHGGYVTLYEDADGISVKAETQYVPLYDENGEPLKDDEGNQLYEEVYTDVVIDLNGHNLGIGIQAEKGDSVTLTDSAEERGTAYVGLSVDGVVIFDNVNVCMSENVVEGDTDVDGEIWIRGDTTIDLRDMTIFNVDVIEGNLTLTGEDGASMKLGADVDLSNGSITIEGSAGIDLGGNDLTSDILVTEDSSFDLNLNGATYTGDIELGDGSSLTIRDSSISKSGEADGTVTANGDASVTIRDGVYDPYDEESSLVLDIADGDMMQSASDASGDVYYESVDERRHASQGHAYDTLTGWTFNAENSTITLYFECLCGKTSVRIINITEDDYTTEVSADGTVTVSYKASSLITALNGSEYAYSVSGTVTLDDKISAGESANGYVRAVIDTPDCRNTGLDTYTYGDGKGIVVRVVTPVTHKLDEEFTDEKTGITYYLCSECQCYVTGEHGEAMYKSEDDLVGDVGLQNTYNDEKQAALDELESWKDEVISGIDTDTPGYDKVIEKIEEIFDELYDEISGMDYVPQTETGDGAKDLREQYAEAVSEALAEALDEALLEVEKTANQEVSRNILEDVYNGLAESGKYSDDTLDELKGEFDAAIADLEGLTVTSEDDLAKLYDEYLQRVLAALYAIKIDRALTTDDSAYEGYVESSEGLDSGVEVVIVDMGTAGYTFTTDAELIYKGTEDLTEDQIADLVDGKGIVAVFDISLMNSNGTEIYVFSGTYTVRIDISQSNLLEYDGLQVVYLGDDGRIEIYETTVNTDEGYLEFTTTHFSEYMILGIGAPLATVEKETDLMAAIIALAVVAGVLLLAGIALLIVLLMKKGMIGGNSKKTAALGIFALLAVVPAGGVAIVVVLAVLAAAFLAADIYLIYAIFTSVPVVEYAQEGDGENATADNAGDVTLSDSEDENRE